MPILDDQLLGSLLHEAGDAFAVPSSGAAEILGRIYGGDNAGTGPGAGGDDAPTASEFEKVEVAAPLRISHSIRVGIRSHRILAVAASLLLVAVVTGATLAFGSSTPAPSTTAARKTASTPHRGRLKATTPAPAATHAGTTKQANAGGTNAPSLSNGRASARSTGSGSTGSTGFAAAGGAAPAVPSLSQTGGGALPASVGQPARIEQTGSLDIEVGRGDLSSAINQLTALATAYGGFVANEQTSSGASSDQGPSGTVTLQIPVASFSAALKEAEALGKVLQLTTKATDVTAQYVDLQSQITALEASRQQYLTIMTKASSIGDILSVQAQLSTLQTQIQQLQGQLNVLGSETSYSMFTAQLSEPGKPPPPPHHRRRAAAPSGLSKAWHDSLHGFAAGVDGLIRVAGPVLFALLCLAALILGSKLSWRRLQRRNL